MKSNQKHQVDGLYLNDLAAQLYEQRQQSEPAPTQASQAV
jgi:hypothetical protein